MAVLGLRFCARAFSSFGEWRPLFIAVRGPLLLRSTGSRRAGSVVVAHGLSCSAACGIFLDQGSNPCALHRQADPQPLRHQGSPLSSKTLIFPVHWSILSKEVSLASYFGPGQFYYRWISAKCRRWHVVVSSETSRTSYHMHHHFHTAVLLPSRYWCREPISLFETYC